MQRRSFLSGIAGTSIASTLGILGTDAAFARTATVAPLAFDSTGSLLNADGNPLTDDSLVPVWAESAATNVDEDGDGNATSYPDGTDIPLVAVDDSASGTVVGIGCPLVSNDADFENGNEEFLLNVLDELVGSGTVRWDRGHDQHYTLDASNGGGPGFGQFASYAGENGYTLEATTDVAGDAASSDAIVVTSPSTSFSASEQSALADYVAGGGVVLLVDQSDYSGYDETQNLNDLASGLGAQFRFNDDQVLDAENNTGSDFVPTTTNFNQSAFASYFENRDGIKNDNSLDPSKTYTVDVVGVADGDTVDVKFDDGRVESIRVLGVDTAEKKGNGQYERPEEWEGLADDVAGLSGVSELAFAEGVAPLLNANGEPLTDAARVPVFAESSAEVQDGDDNGDAVTYPDGTDIPLAAVDGGVVGLGSVLVNDDFDPASDNEEFVCNLWTALVGDSGVVRWDDSHEQYFSSDKFGTFADYAADNGFEVQSGSEIPSDTSDADALVVTSPSAFSEDELSALSSFVDAGGAVFLHDQDDYGDYDETGNLNAIAEALDVTFRFGDAQVVDAENNAGKTYQPTTANLNESAFPSLFAKRTGLDDDGSASELPDADYPYLAYHADLATQFAQDALENETVDISFDPLGSAFNDGVRDPFDRVLAYIEYDADGSGSRDTVYNKQLIADGYARVYESGLSRLGEFLSAETASRAAGTGIWARSNTSLTPVIRNDPIADVYVPKAERVETASGSLSRSRVPVAAAASASQAGAPLVAVDEESGVAMIGGKFVEESYEQSEGFDEDTSGYGNFAFLTNLVDVLGDGDGPVLIDGGQGQFNADYGISAEDAAYYQRYLEGVGVDSGGINDVTSSRLSDARALLVSGGLTEYTDAEKSAVAEFAANGGAVVVLGASSASSADRSTLNDLAAAVGTDLRLSGASVTDGSSNLAGDASLPVTGNFDETLDLFGPYTSGSDEDGDDGDDGTTPSLAVTFPDGNDLGQGSTVRADVVLSNAPNGLAGFDVEAKLADASVASVADASVPEQFGLSDVSIADDGASVVLEASDTESAVEAGATDVTVASVELEPGDAGTTEVVLAVDQVDADDGSMVDTTTGAGTIEVAPVEAIGDNPLPTDVDDDGVYEDLNGNGRVDSQDVVLFFENREDDEITEYVEYFDINGNGRIDFDDINDLFDLL